MAKFIQDIHDRVNFATKKGLTGYHPPEKITSEVHAESMNLWREFVKQFEKTSLIDVYLRPFQIQEVVQLNAGFGQFDNQDYVYMLEGYVPANFNKVLLDNVAYGVGPSTLVLGGTLGKTQWLELFTSTAAPATVTLKLDGVTIFSGVITNKHTFVAFTYIGQISISVIVAGIGITLTRSEVTTTAPTIEIDLIDDDKFPSRLIHPIKLPTAIYPIANIMKQTLRVAPDTAFTFVLLSLIKRPTKPFYAYTIVGDRFIYDDTNSIDFEWNETAHDMIMEKALANLGINMRSQEMIQFSNSQRKLDAAGI